jgi:hypothetical protein
MKSRLTLLPGRIDPPFWWRPWLYLYWVKDWRDRHPGKAKETP